MEILKQMLFEREHPMDIVEFVKENYYKLVRNDDDEFINSMLNPENLKPIRYPGLVPTKTFYFKKIMDFDNDLKLNFFMDSIFSAKSVKTNLRVNDVYSRECVIDNDLIKMYRVTAACLLIQGDFVMENSNLSDKKIVYIPDNEDWLQFKFFNEWKSRYEVELKTVGKVRITFIQHVEFIPVSKNIFRTKTANYKSTLFDEKMKYKNNIITSYDVQKNRGNGGEEFD